MFAETNPGSKTARVLTQVSWLGSIAAEGALFVMIWAPPKPEFPRGFEYV